MIKRPVTDRIVDYIEYKDPERLLLHPDDVEDSKGEVNTKLVAYLLRRFGLDVKVIGNTYVWPFKDLE